MPTTAKGSDCTIAGATSPSHSRMRQALAFDDEREPDDQSNNHRRDDGRDRRRDQVDRNRRPSKTREARCSTRPRPAVAIPVHPGVEGNPAPIAALDATARRNPLAMPTSNGPSTDLVSAKTTIDAIVDHERGTDAQRGRKSYGAVFAEDVEQRRRRRVARMPARLPHETRTAASQTAVPQKRGRVPARVGWGRWSMTSTSVSSATDAN